MSNYYLFSDGSYHSEDELQHYGVKGMRWGHRKAQPLQKSDIRKRYDSAKSDYKQAKKAYNKAYDKASSYTRRHPLSQFVVKKAKAESDKRWDDALNKAKKVNAAKSAYKTAKKSRKISIEKTFKKIQNDSSYAEKFFYNNATRKKAAKYVVDNNMSMADARKKANKVAIRNTAIVLAGLGAYAIASSRR